VGGNSGGSPLIAAAITDGIDLELARSDLGR
jgi:hypothetical protein